MTGHKSERHRTHRGIGICAFVALTTINAGFAQEIEYPYAVLELDRIAGQWFAVEAINNDEIVVGWTSSRGAYLSRRGGFVQLDTLGGAASAALGVNKLGIAVGYADNTCYRRPAIWNKDGVEDLFLRYFQDPCIYGKAVAVNDNRMVTGFYFDDASGVKKTFRAHGDDLVILDEFAGTTEPSDISSDGAVVGYTWRAGSRAFLWSDGFVGELPRFHDGDATWAFGINDLGYIVGRMLPERRGDGSWAIMWDPDLKPHNLHLSGHPINVRRSRALAINNHLQVVGTAWGPWDDEHNSERRAFIWDLENRMRILDRLFPPFFTMKMRDAYDINNQGQIAGYGEDEFGQNPPLLVTPVDPEMSLNIPDGPIRADAINTWTVTGAQPGARITLVYGKEGGGHYVPSCNALKAMLQIADPVPFIRATADDEGKATFEVMVPPRAAAHKGFLFQAVDFHNCEESQLVLKKVE